MNGDGSLKKGAEDEPKTVSGEEPQKKAAAHQASGDQVSQAARDVPALEEKPIDHALSVAQAGLNASHSKATEFMNFFLRGVGRELKAALEATLVPSGSRGDRFEKWLDGEPPFETWLKDKWVKTTAKLIWSFRVLGGHDVPGADHLWDWRTAENLLGFLVVDGCLPRRIESGASDEIPAPVRPLPSSSATPTERASTEKPVRGCPLEQVHDKVATALVAYMDKLTVHDQPEHVA